MDRVRIIAAAYGLKELQLGVQYNRYTGCYRGTSTFPTFCRRFPRGRYIVRVTRHVLVIKDGVAIDHRRVNPNQGIIQAWTE